MQSSAQRSASVTRLASPQVFSEPTSGSGHVRCSLDSSVYVRTLQSFNSSCTFLFRPLFPRLLSLSAACPRWLGYAFFAFSRGHMGSYSRSERFPKEAKQRQASVPIPLPSTRQVKKYNHNFLRTWFIFFHLTPASLTRTQATFPMATAKQEMRNGEQVSKYATMLSYQNLAVSLFIKHSPWLL